MHALAFRAARFSTQEPLMLFISLLAVAIQHAYGFGSECGEIMNAFFASEVAGCAQGCCSV